MCPICPTYTEQKGQSLRKSLGAERGQQSHAIAVRESPKPRARSSAPQRVFCSHQARASRAVGPQHRPPLLPLFGCPGCSPLANPQPTVQRRSVYLLSALHRVSPPAHQARRRAPARVSHPRHGCDLGVPVGPAGESRLLSAEVTLLEEH